MHLHTKYISILCILLKTRNLFFHFYFASDLWTTNDYFPSDALTFICVHANCVFQNVRTELLVYSPHSLPYGRANCLAVEINLVLSWEGKCSLSYWVLQALGQQYLSPKTRNTCCSGHNDECVCNGITIYAGDSKHIFLVWIHTWDFIP